MAYSKITTNKRGVLQAKIQAYGLDPMTGKSKLYVKTVHNTDNLSEAKFKKYVAKAEIEFEESIKLTGKTSEIERRSSDLYAACKRMENVRAAKSIKKLLWQDMRYRKTIYEFFGRTSSCR